MALENIIFWLVFCGGAGYCVYYAYSTTDYGKGFVASILGALLSLILAFYGGGLTMLDSGTIVLMFWTGIGLFCIALMEMFANIGGLYKKV